MAQLTLREDYTRSLRQLMRRAGIASFRELRQRAGISDWPIQQLRRGKIGQLRFATLLQLSSALQVSVKELQTTLPDEEFGEMSSGCDRAQPASPSATEPATLQALQTECARLRSQLNQQPQQLQQDFQQACLQVLEPWLLQWPTAAYAAQNNPQLPAIKLIPLVKPVEQLIAQWDIVAIAPIGTEVPYDPTNHQLIQGTTEPGMPVKVRYAGYRQAGKLLHRAKVSPLPPTHHA